MTDLRNPNGPSPAPRNPIQNSPVSGYSTLASLGSNIGGNYAPLPPAPLYGPTPAPSPAPSRPPSSDHSPASENRDRLVSTAGDVNAQGMFYSMGVQDYVSNEPAIKALVNEKNRLQQQLDNSSNPDVMKFVTVLCAFFNIIATVLVGIGINLVTSDSPPQHSGWILALGIAMTAFATITPIIAAFKKRKR